MTSSIFFFLFVPLLAFILLAINFIFAPHNPYQEKNGAFECGFTSFLGQNRTQFSISFFIFALLFLLFDLEILLVYPYLVSSYINESYGLVVLLIFLLALTLGFVFELGKKALTIDSRQNSLSKIINTHTNVAISGLLKYKIYKKIIKTKKSGLSKNTIVKKIVWAIITTCLIRPLLIYLLGLDINNNMLHRLALNIISGLTFFCVIDFISFSSAFKLLLQQIIFITRGHTEGEYGGIFKHGGSSGGPNEYGRGGAPGQFPEGPNKTGNFPIGLYPDGVRPQDPPAPAPAPAPVPAPAPAPPLASGGTIEEKAQSITVFAKPCDCKTTVSQDTGDPVKHHTTLVVDEINKQFIDLKVRKDLLKLVGENMRHPSDYNALLNKLDECGKDKTLTFPEKRDITCAVYRAVQVQTSWNRTHY